MSPTERDFYEAFLAEMDKVQISADAPAVAVVGECSRAAKRAQMVVDGQPVSPGPFVCGAQGEQMLSGQAREDDRRARLYDALWKIAYQTGSVKLDVVGGHNIVFVVWVQGAPLLRSGDMETIERQLVEYASGLD